MNQVGIEGLGQLKTYWKHHGRCGGVGDPHGEEHRGEHEPKHQPRLRRPHHHDDPQRHPVVESTVLHRDCHDQAAKKLKEDIK